MLALKIKPWVLSTKSTLADYSGLTKKRAQMDELVLEISVITQMFVSRKEPAFTWWAKELKI